MINLRCIIPTHNRADRLDILLESFLPLKGIKGALPDSIDIIENGSNVAAQIVRKFQDDLPVNYEYLETGNKSFALNTSLNKTTDNELLVFLDDDVRIVDKELFIRYREAAACYGEDYFYGGEVIPDFAIAPDPKLIPHMPKSNTGVLFGEEKFVVLEGTSFLGCNWGVYRNKILKINGFNSRFGPGAITGARGQETDAQSRLIKAGLTPVGVTKTRVAHFVPSQAVTPAWILKRKQLSAKWYGENNGTPLKVLYWKLRSVLETPFSFFLSSALRRARFKGFIEGYRNSRRLP